MRFKFIIPGKDKNDFYATGIKDYILKINKYVKATLEYVNETAYSKKVSEKEISNNLDLEAKSILKLINPKDYLVLIDIHAKDYDTLSLTNEINNITKNNSNLVFVIGSSYGLSNILRKRANFSFSLSKLTFTHYESLLILLEQIYRICKINNNEDYNK